MTQQELASASRQTQLVVRARLMADVAKLWPTLDPKNLDTTFPGWLAAMRLLIKQSHGESSRAAVAYYQAARRAAINAAPISVKLAAPPADDWMDKALGFAAPGMMGRETAQPGAALVVTLGTAARIAMDGGRSTVLGAVQQDTEATGWYRATSSSACSFCAELADKGITSRNESAVGFESHNHCSCTPAVAWTSSTSSSATDTTE